MTAAVQQLRPASADLDTVLADYIAHLARSPLAATSRDAYRKRVAGFLPTLAPVSGRGRPRAAPAPDDLQRPRGRGQQVLVLEHCDRLLVINYLDGEPAVHRGQGVTWRRPVHRYDREAGQVVGSPLRQEGVEASGHWSGPFAPRDGRRAAARFAVGRHPVRQPSPGYFRPQY